MLKRLTVILLLMILCACRSVPAKPADFSAVIISDLHLQTAEVSDNPYVPLSSLTKEVLNAVAAETIERHPDALILCGDNTNSGNVNDLKYLHDVLRKVKESGTAVIQVPGNHDFNLSDRDTYDEYTNDLCEPDDRDTESLSYMKIMGNMMILAMDDSSYRSDNKGGFSLDTMTWLKNMLNQAEEEGLKVLFISHHNVLLTETGDNYRINNPGLRNLLKRKHVRLCLSGHTHSQMIFEEDGMYEIVTGTILGSIHPAGFLQIKDDSVSYVMERADFSSNPDLEEYALVKDKESASQMYDVFMQIFRDREYSQEDSEACAALAMKYMDYYGKGQIGGHFEEILNDPDYDKMIEGLKDANYGPWMESVLKNPPQRADRIRFEYKD